MVDKTKHIIKYKTIWLNEEKTILASKNAIARNEILNKVIPIAFGIPRDLKR